MFPDPIGGKMRTMSESVPVEAARTADELYAHAESLIARLGAPFVPIKHEGVIYIRPPLS